jgi:lipopolysaccharide transport system ATP-binding protein
MLESKVQVCALSKIFYAKALDAIREPGAQVKPASDDDKVALDNLNLTFSSGDTIGIIGRNGAGKSTLLSIIAGLSEQTEGEVNITGKVTAVMTLGVGLREDLTGRDNIYLDGELQGKTRDEINLLLDEIIAFAELDTFIDKPVKTYSTGMKTRLAFSMLVGIEPEILIIDEALSAGDIFFAEKAGKKIKEICDKGKIVLLVSHSMGTINTMCNRCLWMEQGKVIMDGKPTEITKQYLKKVQEEDQGQALSTYQAPVSKTLEHARYIVRDVRLKREGRDDEQAIFYTKEAFGLEIEMIRSSSNQGKLRVIIERLDGLIVSCEYYDLDEDDVSDTKVCLVIELFLDALALNRGYYQIKLDVFESDERTNEFIRFFEVKNPSAASGGVSLLHYPAEISLMNEEVSVCSDSKELMDG